MDSIKPWTKYSTPSERSMLRNITDMMAEKNEKLRAGFDQTVLPCGQIRWDQTAESSASL